MTASYTGSPVVAASLKPKDKITAVSLNGVTVYKMHTVNRVTSTGDVVVTSDGGYNYTISNPNKEWVLVRFTKKLPENWPPQPGDLWRVEGSDYFVGNGSVITSSARTSGTTGHYALSAVTDSVENWNGSATLLYRRGVKEPS